MIIGEVLLQLLCFFFLIGSCWKLFFSDSDVIILAVVLFCFYVFSFVIFVLRIMMFTDRISKRFRLILEGLIEVYLIYVDEIKFDYIPWMNCFVGSHDS